MFFDRIVRSELFPEYSKNFIFSAKIMRIYKSDLDLTLYD